MASEEDPPPEVIIGLTSTVFAIIGLSIFCFSCGLSYSCLKGTDSLKFKEIFTFGIYVWDFFTDIVFILTVYSFYIAWNYDTVLLIIVVISIVFLLFTLTKNYFDLYKIRNVWKIHPLHGVRYKQWLDDYSHGLYFFSFVSGSPFAAVNLANSNLFGYKFFGMGLTKKDIRDWQSKRFFNVVLGENVPQLALAITYVAYTRTGNIVIWLDIVTTGFSAIVSTIGYIRRNRLIRIGAKSKDSFFSIKIGCNQKLFIDQISKCKHKRKIIGLEIGKILSLTKECVEIVSVEKFQDAKYEGLLMSFFIHTSSKLPMDIFLDLEDSIKIDDDISALSVQIARAWGLNENCNQNVEVYDLQFINKDIITAAEDVVNDAVGRVKDVGADAIAIGNNAANVVKDIANDTTNIVKDVGSDAIAVGNNAANVVQDLANDTTNVVIDVGDNVIAIGNEAVNKVGDAISLGTNTDDADDL